MDNFSKSARVSAFVLTFYALVSNSFAAENISLANFVNDASVNCITEIDTAYLALEQATSPYVKAFAQQMLDDHTALIVQLNELAQQKGLEIAEETDLKNKSAGNILEMEKAAPAMRVFDSMKKYIEEAMI